MDACIFTILKKNFNYVTPLSYFSTFHEIDCQLTDDTRSLMLDRLLGTLFLSVSTTIALSLSNFRH